MDLASIRAAHSDLSDHLTDGATGLAPSKIASQFYCEQKVDLSRAYGDIETPTKVRGTEAHETAAEDAEPIDRDEFWDAMERGERQIIVETPILADAAEFILTGKPDAVLYDGQVPRVLFERKTTSRPDTLFKNQRLQAWLYGFMLDTVGYDTDDLTIAILTHEQSLPDTMGKELQELTIRNYDALGPGTHELNDSPRAVLHLSPYSKIEFLEDLSWALGYWRDARDPVPTETAAKCRACEYSDVCPESRA